MKIKVGSCVSAATGLTLAGALALGGCATHPHAPPPLRPPPPPPTAEAPPPSYAAPPSNVAVRPLPGSTQDFVVNVGDRVYFDYDKANIRADAVPILQAQAAWLVRYPEVRVRIEGNCDERGTRQYNLALGARRAEAAREFLMQNGVSAGRIATISYGKERPIDPGHDESAWAKDRNDHTAIIAGAQ